MQNVGIIVGVVLCKYKMRLEGLQPGSGRQERQSGESRARTACRSGGNAQRGVFKAGTAAMLLL